MSELVRKQTYITSEQDRCLKEFAERYHTSEADLLRRALESWLIEHRAQDADDPFERLVGFASGPTEVNHTDIYT